MSDQKRTPSVLVLPDIAYERRMVSMNINGDPFHAEGWVNGPGCPGRVKAEYARRLQRFTAAFMDSTEAQNAAMHEFLVDALRILFEMPASEYERLDLISGDQQRAKQILMYLGWWGDEGEDAANPEAEGEDERSENLTTLPSSPTSVRPTRQRRTAAAG